MLIEDILRAKSQQVTMLWKWFCSNVGKWMWFSIFFSFFRISLLFAVTWSSIVNVNVAAE